MSSPKISLVEISQALGVDNERNRQVTLGEVRCIDEPDTAVVEVSVFDEYSDRESAQDYEVVIRKKS